MLRFIDFFAGIGGFRHGMEMAGHQCVGHCEIDKFADRSYRAMHMLTKQEQQLLMGMDFKRAVQFIKNKPKGREFYADDIRNVEPGDLPESDCYCAGFPCQAFSIAGERRGFEDMRGTLVFEIFRLARVKRPKILFLENVAGLLNHDEGRTFGTILSAMDELGYDAEWQLLNSKDFGVPQNRERVLIIGHLRGAGTRKVFPIAGSNKKALRQIVGGSQGDRVYDPAGLSCTLASQAGGHGAKTGLYLINKNKDRIEFRDDFNCLDSNYYKGLDCHQQRTGVMEIRAVLTPDRIEKRQNGRRMKDPGEEMFTLTSQDKHGVMISKCVRAGGLSSPHDSKQSWSTYEIDGRIRRLTPRECFRLQGFEDEYFDRAAKVNSDSQLYKQAGNSVTVNVIFNIAERLG